MHEVFHMAALALARFHTLRHMRAHTAHKPKKSPEIASLIDLDRQLPVPAASHGVLSPRLATPGRLRTAGTQYYSWQSASRASPCYSRRPITHRRHCPRLHPGMAAMGQHMRGLDVAGYDPNSVTKFMHT